MHTTGDDALEESSLKRWWRRTWILRRIRRGSCCCRFVWRFGAIPRWLPRTRSLRPEFEAMMEAMLQLNAGGSSGLRRKQSLSRRGVEARTHSNYSHVSRDNDPLASCRAGPTVFCPALSAYIAVSAIPPKYLRWLKQCCLTTKEVCSMMLIGRHRNAIHPYEVLEMVQDSKSTMFLILELVRGGNCLI